MSKLSLFVITLSIWIFFLSYAACQSIIVDPGPTSTSDPTPSPTNPYAAQLNCTRYTSCATCAQQSACGWCAGDGGHCIHAFNFLAFQGSSLETCFGNIDNYFWFQCSLGAKSFASLAIAGAIVVVLFLLMVCACCVRMRRRRRQDTHFDTLMGRLTKKYSSKKKGKSADKDKKKEKDKKKPRATATLDSPTSTSKLF